MKKLSSHSRLSALLSIIVSVVLVCTTAACSFGARSGEESSSTPQATTGPITVTATLNQWGSLAKEIGGDKVKVTSILSASTADAHDFEPTTKDVKELHDAQVVLTNGAGYDTWASKNLPNTVTHISVGSIVGAVEGDNPHLWFSRDARKAVAKELNETFARLRPDDKSIFNDNYQAWQKKEDALEKQINAFSEKHSNLTYAASEDIATYLMSDMGFEDMTPTGYKQAIASEAEPSPSDIKAMQTLLKDGEVSIFVNNAQESTDLSKQLVEDAKKAQIPVQEVTEQMPKEYNTLTDWIEGLFKSIAKDINSQYDTSNATEPSSVSTQETN